MRAVWTSMLCLCVTLFSLSWSFFGGGYEVDPTKSEYQVVLMESLKQGAVKGSWVWEGPSF